MTDEAASDQPEVVEEPQEATAMVLDGSKLMRIGSMTKAMLNEVRQAPLDEAGRRRLQHIHKRSLQELSDVLPDELRDELHDIFIPSEREVPSESELRIAQAQLVGWLEGLFNGIQAALFTQQMAARSQLEQMRGQRALEQPQDNDDESSFGVYL